MEFGDQIGFAFFGVPREAIYTKPARPPHVEEAMSTPASHPGFRFMDLPPELRDQVYANLMRPEDHEVLSEDGLVLRYKYDLRFFRTCKQIYHEAQRVFQVLPNNIFARIETPWEQAGDHVRVEGMVPILAEGQAAERFSNIHVRIIIDAPFHESDEENKKFIVFLHDLEKFTRMWKFSDLSYAGDLNPHLRLRLMLQNSSVPDGDEYVKMNKALQQRILAPFGHVKNLREVLVESTDRGFSIDKATEENMRKQMAVPYESPESCLERAQLAKDEGDRLAEGVEGDADGTGHVPPDYPGAIKKYTEAFEAIHVICVKRRRSIWGDAWFDRVLTSGMFAHKQGQMVRLILRVELVSAVTNAYFQHGMISDAEGKIRNLSEAHFWGMRTISLIREHISPNDIPHTNFPTAARRAMGMLYLRTGQAAWELAKSMARDSSEVFMGTGDGLTKALAKQLMLVSRRWCPDENEIESVLWRLGLS